MTKTGLYRTAAIILTLTALISSCIDSDNFTAYTDKNLVGHKLLSEWVTNQDDTYMNYEEVSSSIAGTENLPDTSAQIYRLENKNLVPNGDFEASATGFMPADWTAFGGTNSIKTSSVLTGKSFSFDLSTTEYIEYDLNNLSCGINTGNSYLFRFDMSGNIQPYYYEIYDVDSDEYVKQYIYSIEEQDSPVAAPDDLSNVQVTDFTIKNESEVFHINFKTSGTTQTGEFDNFRVVKSDQDQEISIELAYEDEDRIDSLELLSGTYRFSIWVKADPETLSTNNSFNADAVTLRIKSFDVDGTDSREEYEAFSASDYDSFTEWTQIYIDAELAVYIPEDTSRTVIKLAVSAWDSTGAQTIDAGSILISNPELLYSEDGIF